MSPTYNYKCNECNHEYEEMHSILEERKICPVCSKKSLEKVITFKGSVVYKGSQAGYCRPGSK